MKILERKPITAVDRIFLSRSQCGFRDGQPLVCCRELAVAVTSTTPTPEATSSPAIKVETTTKQTIQLESLLPQAGECGLTEDDYIYGGNETLIDEYPWMALLQYAKRKFHY